MFIIFQLLLLHKRGLQLLLVAFASFFCRDVKKHELDNVCTGDSLGQGHHVFRLSVLSSYSHHITVEPQTEEYTRLNLVGKGQMSRSV